MTTVTKKNTRRALNVFLLLVGAVGFFMALGNALSTRIADEDKSKNSNATDLLAIVKIMVNHNTNLA